MLLKEKCVGISFNYNGEYLNKKKRNFRFIFCKNGGILYHRKGLCEVDI